MKFKQTLLIALLIALPFFSNAQDCFHINLRVGERAAIVDAIEIDDELIYLDRRGNIRPENTTGADYDYYGRFDDDELKGKLKSINGLPVKYYDRFDREELRGKLKSIGSIKFTWYDVFDRDELRGKLKSVNGIQLKYYDVFDWDELRGKLKSIGNTQITYYDRFDRDRNMGRIKSVKGRTAHVSVRAAMGLASEV